VQRLDKGQDQLEECEHGGKVEEPGAGS
jgi:hypothetical protein